MMELQTQRIETRGYLITPTGDIRTAEEIPISSDSV
ncbi:hypothetical protein SBA3_830018 [Candidatus Sulfopaludibacter sp. SbA3]|nr:hypothetical protein SBA3_830018 [Candidatus Sulfopaludibacter sp. SbA3]